MSILSRLPHSPKAPQEEELSSDSVPTICGGLTCPVAETHCLSAAVVDTVAESEDRDIAEFAVKDWRRAQNEDELLGPWMSQVRSKKRPRRQDFPRTTEHSTMFKNFDSFCICRGALHKETTVDGKVRTQLVLPSAFVNRALRGLHNDIGHPGRDRTTSLSENVSGGPVWHMMLKTGVNSVNVV